MQIFKTKLEFDFMGKRYAALGLSIILIVLSITSIATRGLNFGIDFTAVT